GIIGGSSLITKTGTGTLTFTVSNSYTGGTKVSGGTLRISNDNQLGTVPGALADNVTLDGGTLQFGDDAIINGNRIIAITANGGTVTSNLDNTSAGIMTGAGTLHKAGTGNLIVNAVRIGGLSVDAGAVTIPAGRDTANKLSSVASISVNTAGAAKLDLND